MVEYKLCKIKEQSFDDPVSGLTFQFEVGEDGHTRLKLFGELPFGNREFEFGDSGMLGGAGTLTSGTCRPTWAIELD